MSLFLFLFIFVFSAVIYVLYFSYNFQTFIHKRNFKSFLINDFIGSVKGNFISSAYFASSHKIASKKEYNSFSIKHKLSFNNCYNIVNFKTVDADWELFFYLVKDGMKFGEILSIRCFPKTLKIKSEGNVEKNYSRLNTFTNNRYLTGVLETKQVNEYLKWLIRQNGDILLISNNNLHFKVFLNSKKISKTRLLDMVKAINGIKNQIYKEDNISY